MYNIQLGRQDSQNQGTGKADSGDKIWHHFPFRLTRVKLGHMNDSIGTGLSGLGFWLLSKIGCQARTCSAAPATVVSRMWLLEIWLPRNLHLACGLRQDRDRLWSLGSGNMKDLKM